ncbi:MAG: enoyl-CoA hydratase/isomerase family protein [Burkholderiaceae bacterium]
MPLLCHRDAHVATLTLSRPQGRNAWDEDFNEGLVHHLGELEADPDIRCVILTGDPDGGAFSAGANLKDARTHRSESTKAFIEGLPKWRRFVTHLLTEFPKPVVAAVNGYAIGIGCIATFCCDLIVASHDAQWRLPQARLGILPAYGGSVRLARWVGQGQAMKMALGFDLDAAEAHRIGLAQWLVAPDALMDEASRVARHIAQLPPLAVRLVKESLLRGQDIPNLADAALADVYRFMVLESTEDAREAHEAWRERRDPQVRGR